MASNFMPLEVIKHSDGVIIPVTYRMRDGMVELSFSIQKEFDRDGQVERTVWLKREHIPGIINLVEQLPGQLGLFEDRLRAARRAGRTAP